jgi:PAS domain-containing protein
MARLLRAFAWEQSPLGNPDLWPERLRGATELMLGSAFPAFIWWGAELVQLYNDAAIAICRYRHPGALGQPARRHWVHFWNTLGVIAEQAMTTGASVLGEDLLLVDEQRTSPEDGAWYTVSASPIRDDQGSIGGVFLTLIDTTRRLRAETRVRATEVRVKKVFQQAPGVVLICHGSDHVIEFTNDAANRLLGARELPGRSGRQLALDLGGLPLVELLDKAFRSGERTEGFALTVWPPRRSDLLIGRLHLDFSVVPIFDSVGTVTGTFVTAFDVTERVRAQRILRENADRQSFLLTLSDALRMLDNPFEIQATAAQILGERLQVSRAFYCDVEYEEGEACFVVNRDYHAPNVSSTVGRFPARRFGTLIREILEGRSIAVCDVVEERELSDDERAAYVEVGAMAWCAVPLVKHGVNVAVLCVHQTSAREWEDHEMTLLEETAERTWAAVERARAEAALRLSEERFRRLAEKGNQ